MALVSVLFTAACSDYQLTPDNDAGGGSRDAAGADQPARATLEDSCADFSWPDPYDAAIDEDCFTASTAGAFDPVVEWQWTGPDVGSWNMGMAAPVVGNLTDDDGDGDVDANDVPDVVAAVFADGDYGSSGALVVWSGDGAGIHWIHEATDEWAVGALSGVALGDLDGDGTMEVCAAGTLRTAVCLGHDGTPLWNAGGTFLMGAAPSIADLDADGLAEVVVGREIYDFDGTPLGTGAHGKGAGSDGGTATSFAADLDGDGMMEVVAGNAVYRRDGSLVWHDGSADGYPAVADLDLDGQVEVIKMEYGELQVRDGPTGALLWAAALPGGGMGGPPVVADLDGDGAPEIGVAGGTEYTAFDADGSVLWTQTVQDASSHRTGSSVFDFEGDGAAEIVYADEQTLWVLSGVDGSVKMALAEHASGTWLEYPVIADVDGDGSTEVVFASNDYGFAGWHGLTVIGSATNSWSRTRPIWNQHAYSIGNVTDDGAVPLHAEPSWLGHNSFRAAAVTAPAGELIPDLALGLPTQCTDCALGQALVAIPIESRGLATTVPTTVRVYREDSGGRMLVLEEPVGPIAPGDTVIAGPFTVESTVWQGARLIAVLGEEGLDPDCNDGDLVLDLGPWPCGEGAGD